jgi:hypothetical protein
MPSKLKRQIEETEKKMNELEKKMDELDIVLKSNPSDYQILVDAQKEKDEISLEYEEVGTLYLSLMEEKENYD